MKKIRRRKKALFAISAIALVSFVVFKKAQQTARIQPRYVLESVQILMCNYDYNGTIYDRQINVIVKDKWPFFAQPRSGTTSWGLNDEYVSFRYKGQEQGGTEIRERLMPPKSGSDPRCHIVYKLPLSQIPKGATEAYFTSVILINGEKNGASMLPIRVRLK